VGTKVTPPICIYLNVASGGVSCLTHQKVTLFSSNRIMTLQPVTCIQPNSSAKWWMLQT